MSVFRSIRFFSLIAVMAMSATASQAVVLDSNSGTFESTAQGIDVHGDPSNYCNVNNCDNLPFANRYLEKGYELRLPGLQGNHYHLAALGNDWLAFHEGLDNDFLPEPFPGGDNLLKLARVDKSRFDFIGFDELSADCDDPPIGTNGCGIPPIPWENVATDVTGYRDDVAVFSMTIPADTGTTPTTTYTLNWTDLDYVIFDVQGNEGPLDGSITVLDNFEVELVAAPVPSFGPLGLGAVLGLTMLVGIAAVGRAKATA